MTKGRKKGNKNTGTPAEPVKRPSSDVLGPHSVNTNIPKRDKATTKPTPAEPLPSTHNKSNFRVTRHEDDTAFVDSMLQNRYMEPIVINATKFPHPSPSGLNKPVTAALLYAGTSHALRSLPGFLETPLKPPPSTGWPFVIKDVPNMGKGLFARETIHFGELIFCEIALIVMAVVLIAVEEDADRYRELLVSRLDENSRREFYSLHNCHDADYGLITGILDTNLRAIGKLPGRNNCNHAALGLISSRINHSCSPNAEAKFDIKSLSISIYASRTIEQGEQIFLNYTSNSYAPRWERRAQLLTKYAFTCNCSTCSLPKSRSKRSDARRRLMSTITQQNKLATEKECERLAKWTVDHSLPDDHIIKQSERFIEMLETEKLCMACTQLLHCVCLAAAYCALGDREAAMRWGDRVSILGDMVPGSDYDWKAYMEVPEESPYWRSRLTSKV